MYGLLIVDDEPVIVDGLVVLFQNAGLPGLEIFEANSAAEALDCLQRARIDIVLADIQMPGMDGLELMKKIRLQWPRCKVIFLTGHDNFEYAQTAIRCGISDYLLKTEHEEVFVRAVEKAIEELSEDFRNEDLINTAEQRMQASLPLLRKEYIADLIQDDPDVLQVIGQQFQALKIPLDHKSSVLMALIRIDGWGSRRYRPDRTSGVYAVESIAERYLSARLNVFSIIHDRSCILLFMQPKSWEEKACSSETARKQALLFAGGTLESILEACKGYLDVDITLVSRSKFCKWEEIGKSFSILRSLLNRSSGLSQGTIILENDTAADELTESLEYGHMVQFRKKKVQMLEVYLEGGMREEFKRQYFELITMAGYEHGNTGITQYDLYYALVSMFLSYMCKSSLQGTLSGKIDLRRMVRMDEHASWEDVVDYFEEIADILFNFNEENRADNGQVLIRKIRTYIREHISEDISLTRLADVFHYNPFYLSHMYRQLSGESLSEFISSVKFNRSKELLKQNHMKILEISRAVGFESASNFTRFFRRLAGMSPQEYRELAEQ